MADAPYGTSFPENYGEMFSSRPPVYNPLEVGVPNILGRLGNSVAQDQPFMTPKIDLSPQANMQEGNPAIPPSAIVDETRPPKLLFDEVGPGYIPTGSEGFENWKPETRAQDEFFKLLSQMPKRERPDFKRRIAGGIATLAASGNPAAGEKIIDEPYNQAIGDFKLRADLLKDLASTERATNVNERQVINNILQNKRAEERIAIADRAQKEKEAQNQRVNILERYRIDNPNSQIRQEVSGELVLINPKTGEVKKTGIRGQDIPEEYRIMLMNAMATNRDTLQAEHDRRELERRHELEMEEIRERARLDLEKIKKEAEAKGLTPEQLGRKRFEQAALIWNSDPNSRRFLTLGNPSTYTFNLKKPADIPGFWKYTGTDVGNENAKTARDYIGYATKIYGEDVRNYIPAEVFEAAAKYVEPTKAKPVTPPIRSTGPGPGTGPAPATNKAKRDKARALLASKKLRTDDAAIDQFLKQNPNFK